MWYIQMEYYSAIKGEKELVLCSNTNKDKPKKHYAQWKKWHKGAHIVWFHLLKMSKRDKYTETD